MRDRREEYKPPNQHRAGVWGWLGGWGLWYVFGAGRGWGWSGGWGGKLAGVGEAHQVPRQLHRFAQHSYGGAALLRVLGQRAHRLDGALRQRAAGQRGLAESGHALLVSLHDS